MLEGRLLFNPVTKKLFEYGLLGLALASVLVVGLQNRPVNILPSNGTVQVSIASDPSIITCPDPHARANVTSLVVTIGSVMVHRTGALNLTGEWINASQFEKKIDLTSITKTSTLLATIDLPQGTVNLVRIDVVSATATTTSSSTPVNVVVSSGHLQVQVNNQVTAGKNSSINVRVVQPHLVCEGNGKLRLTPNLEEASATTD